WRAGCGASAASCGRTSVYPSGGAFAAASVPMMVFAPTRLSTTSCWPHSSASFCPGMRARVSTALPAENGTMRWTGLFGQVCAAACAPQSKRLRTTPMRIVIPDDYQDIVHRLKCFELLRGHEVLRFREPARDADELAERLADAEVVVAIRERVAFPRSLLERLPKLELLALVGRHSK